MDTDSPNAPKRRRTEDTQRETVRDGEVWFDDGNIVLLCENSEGKNLVAFRVHKSIISMYSEVLKDMCTFCTDGDKEETYEGCPAVFMQDSHIDMRRFLKALTFRK